ncbi:MAG: hypothetical protein D3903_03665 [Candidatus Electrothrix sp. GM3_4]|nr:hypothetical protein [Candidatus Electrothrix sp. GM3_4]
MLKLIRDPPKNKIPLVAVAGPFACPFPLDYMKGLLPRPQKTQLRQMYSYHQDGRAFLEENFRN